MSEAGDATRLALLDTAEELLITKGVAGITTRKVADRAGVNQALVHYHFGTIEELLLAALEPRRDAREGAFPKDLRR